MNNIEYNTELEKRIMTALSHLQTAFLDNPPHYVEQVILPTKLGNAVKPHMSIYSSDHDTGLLKTGLKICIGHDLEDNMFLVKWADSDIWEKMYVEYVKGEK